jgi:hypothetical protein
MADDQESKNPDGGKRKPNDKLFSASVFNVPVIFDADKIDESNWSRIFLTQKGVGKSALLSALLAQKEPDRHDELLALVPKIESLDSRVLRVIVDGAEPAAPFLGSPDFPEETLRVLARTVQDDRELQRSREEEGAKEKIAFRGKALLAVLTATSGLISAATILVLKEIFFPTP